jgi:hypothetical protein
MEIDFFKCEEKLIKAEMTVRDCIKQKEVLSKIDEILEKYDSRTSEKLSITIKTSEHLSKDGSLLLPLKVRGRMLGVGRHKERYYTREELMKSVDKYKGKKFPMKLDHRDKEAGSTIGMVDSIYWDNQNDCIMYEAHINDATHARNILDGAIKEVSATIYSIKAYNEKLGIVALDLDFQELSAVESGAYLGNTIEVVKDAI